MPTLEVQQNAPLNRDIVEMTTSSVKYGYNKALLDIQEWMSSVDYQVSKLDVMAKLEELMTDDSRKTISNT